MIKDIEVVVFDLGRVLLNIDPKRCYQAFIDIGIPLHYETRLRALFFEYESGILSEEEVLQRVENETEIIFDPTSFWGCWEAMILEFIPEMIYRLEKLAQRYICVLLSNTNRKHQYVFEKKFKQQYGKEMQELFDYVFYSHDVGFIKPSSDIYCYVEKRIAKPTSSFIFFDDLEENVRVASERGWNTFHVTSDLNRTLEYVDQLL